MGKNVTSLEVIVSFSAFKISVTADETQTETHADYEALKFWTAYDIDLHCEHAVFILLMTEY